MNEIFEKQQAQLKAQLMAEMEAHKRAQYDRAAVGEANRERIHGLPCSHWSGEFGEACKRPSGHGGEHQGECHSWTAVPQDTIGLSSANSAKCTGSDYQPEPPSLDRRIAARIGAMEKELVESEHKVLKLQGLLRDHRTFLSVLDRNPEVASILELKDKLGL